MHQIVGFEQNDPVQISSNSVTRKANISHLTLEQLRKNWIEKIIPNCDISNTRHCFTHRYKPSKANGYVQISIGNVKYSVTVLTYALWYRHYDNRKHVSHRCGNPACCHPEHLTMEDQAANESRKNCILHGSYTNCIHIPKCIGHKHV